MNPSLFPPSRSFTQSSPYTADAVRKMQEIGSRDSEAYWAEAARELDWDQPFKKRCEWNPPELKWFSDGKLNVSKNCVDRHFQNNPERTALVWEGEEGTVIRWSYRDLYENVLRFSALLKKLGVRSGDRVAIYLPLVPQSVAALLGCARIGAVHNVVFAGFSGDSLKDRIQDSQAETLITADFGYRKGAKVDLEAEVQKCVKASPTLKNIIRLERDHVTKFPFTEDFWKPLLEKYGVTSQDIEAEKNPASFPAEHPLFILYTSGSTGKPKGLLHTSGGYLTGALRSFKLVFDYQPQDLYWCTADIGWITGHTYLVYGPLAAGAQIFMYEGAPIHPTPARFWQMIEKHKINILYTAPTAIRTFMKLGDSFPQSCDLSSLRLLGSVGEPINPEAWKWYHEKIGGSRCPIVDTYWQTETGSIVVSPLPSTTTTKPGSATFPLPGYSIAVVDREGRSVAREESGLLTIQKPWPSMARTIWGDAERFKKQYFSEFKDPVYFTGDGAKIDAEGYLWCLGRVDDVLNVSGHRLGTAEVESALVSHPAVAEAAVVGRPDEIKGQGVVAYVTLRSSHRETPTLKQELKQHVAREIGAIAKPDEIVLTEGLPKTRSGKIMRRLLRELASSGQIKGDMTTLEDFNVLSKLQTSTNSEE